MYMLSRLKNGKLCENERRLIRDDFLRTQQTSGNIVAKLEEYDNKEIGIELLHVWFRDLLGKSN